MKTIYSKTLSDINYESNIRLLDDNTQCLKQKNESKRLISCKQRIKCIICANTLQGEEFKHRGILFIVCQQCEHIQTKHYPPDDYPQKKFESIYPKLSKIQYQDRIKRIYKPKLDWIVNSLTEFGYTYLELKKMRWLEVGSGAGYFVNCLLEDNFYNIKGFDSNQKLVEIGNNINSTNVIRFYKGKFSDLIKMHSADIYVSFFVLEHINDTHELIMNLKKLPKGSLFIFSVPVFGLSCILENVFENNSARNLDCVIHTQLFTDKSINYFLTLANFNIVSQWIFGQDADDFYKLMILNCESKYSEKLFNVIKKKLTMLKDSFQKCLDNLNLSDQRHIIAIKE